MIVKTEIKKNPRPIPLPELFDTMGHWATLNPEKATENLAIANQIHNRLLTKPIGIGMKKALPSGK